jgi:hypothetical protein
MPPRYSYWTILAGGLPTAFRAAERADLLPTFNRIREKHPDAEMKWFARGRLWASPEEAQADVQRARARRDRDWRPGGDHRDPRQTFKTKRPREAARREGPSRDTSRREGAPRDTPRREQIPRDDRWRDQKSRDGLRHPKSRDAGSQQAKSRDTGRREQKTRDAGWREQTPRRPSPKPAHANSRPAPVNRRPARPPKRRPR